MSPQLPSVFRLSQPRTLVSQRDGQKDLVVLRTQRDAAEHLPARVDQPGGGTGGGDAPGEGLVRQLVDGPAVHGGGGGVGGAGPDTGAGRRCDGAGARGLEDGAGGGGLDGAGNERCGGACCDGGIENAKGTVPGPGLVDQPIAGGNHLGQVAQGQGIAGELV